MDTGRRKGPLDRRSGVITFTGIEDRRLLDSPSDRRAFSLCNDRKIEDKYPVPATSPTSSIPGVQDIAKIVKESVPSPISDLSALAIAEKVVDRERSRRPPDAPPGRHTGQKIPLTPEQAKTLLRRAREHPVRLVGCRNYTMISVQLSTALRSADLLRMTWSDVIDLDHDHGIVPTLPIYQVKTGVPVSVSLSDESRLALNELAHLQFQAWGQEITTDTPIFLSTRRTKQGTLRAVSYSNYFHQLQKLYDSIGLDVETVSTHSLRKTLPMKYYDETHDIAGAGAILGHTTLSSTLYYLVKRQATEVSSIQSLFESRHDFVFGRH